MKLIKLLLTLVTLLWHWSSDAGSRHAKMFVVSIVVTNQSQLDEFINRNMTDTPHLAPNLTLAGDNTYVLDIIKLINIYKDSSQLIMESEGGPAEITCTASESDPKKLKEVAQPISGASLVHMDGLIITGCPVPIMIEEVNNVTIQNCIFQHHEHGALSIYNTRHITVKNCRFRNNTSDSLFATKVYQGSAGGVSISYNFNATKASPVHDNNAIVPTDTVTSCITNCMFTDNSARLLNGQGGTSADVLTNNIYPGRGGAVFVLINTALKLIFNFSDNVVMNNFAEVFAGGVYCHTRGSSFQKYTFNNNVFKNNTALRAGGLGLFHIKSPTNAIHNDIYNCTFQNNIASQKGGAVLISSIYEPALTNVFVTFKKCNFSNNTAILHGGAFDVATFNKMQLETLITFVNCTFEGNVADIGAAINLFLYGAKFYNVTFKDNRESAVQVIGCVVEIHDEVRFVGNKAKNGGALHIISFGQIRMFSGASLTFEKNEGRIGASIVVQTKISQLPVYYSQLIYNPECFLMHQDSKVPFLSVDDLKLEFIDNKAVEGTAILMNTAQQCSWIEYSPPYFDPAAVLRWNFLNISESSNHSQNTSQIESSIIDIDVLNDVGNKYPGEQFSLNIKLTDEMNRTASGFLQLHAINMNNQSMTRYKVHPAVAYHHYAKPLNVSIVTETNTGIDNGTSVMVVVKKFIKDKKSIASNFTLRVVSCLAGFKLTYDSMVDGFTCQHYHGNARIGTCKEDHTILLLTDGQWGLDQSYTEQPENLTVYPCPPGYCRCFYNLCGVGHKMCSYAYFNDDPNEQCNCDREGYLCGDCKDSKGVSTLLNRCVDCGDINILVLAALYTTLIIVMLCKDFSFSALLFPTIFFINMVSYVGEGYPTTYDQVGKYMYFINSLLSLYFPYDFCLYSGATPLATYAFRYLPICLTIIICSIGLKLHQYIFKRVKRFSWNNLWLLLTLQYSHVVYTSMTILHCPQVINENGEHESRWFVKGTLECFTGYHIPLALCAIIVLVTCTLLIPFLGLVATGKLTKPYSMRKLTKHLQYSFKENLPWWCMIELGRKLVFLLLLIPFPQNTGPPMFILMITFAVYAYVLPYKEMFMNIIELFFQLMLMIFLTLRSTKYIVDEYLRFPNHVDDDHDTHHTTKCSNETGTTYLTWILFPFAYLPLVVIIGIFIIKMLLRLWQRVCYKDHIKEHRDHLLQEKSTTDYHINVTNAKYFLLGINDDKTAFFDATIDDTKL